MRRFLLILALFLALPVAAEKEPPGLQPLPEPPPPEGVNLDSALEPQVTIIKRGGDGEDRIEEYRVKGRLYMVKVTPPHGRPYYLIDKKGDGSMVRQESLDGGLSVPMWVIGTF